MPGTKSVFTLQTYCGSLATAMLNELDKLHEAQLCFLSKIEAEQLKKDKLDHHIAVR
jgi:hypothetical protein